MLNSRKCNLMIDGHKTNHFNILRGVPQGDTASPYIFIIVLEILLLRIKHDKNLTFISFEEEGYEKFDGGNLKVDPLKCFADDMTVIMEETTQNLKKMKEIFQNIWPRNQREEDESHPHWRQLGQPRTNNRRNKI